MPRTLKARERGKAVLLAENADLRQRLAESEETLRAIREGEVDAVIVTGSKGDRVFALSEAENLPRLMVETMNEAGLAIAPDGLLVFCNDRACALLGRPKDKLIGRHIATFVAPKDAARFQNLIRAAQSANADGRIEFISGSGTMVPMHMWASHLARPDGPLISLVGTDLSRIEADQTLIAQLKEQKQQLRALKDDAITARKAVERANAALSAGEERMQQALQVSRSFTFDWQPEPDRVLRSASCAQILGMDPDRACRDTSRRFLRKVHPEDVAAFQRTLKSLRPNNRSYTTEYRYVRDDGSTVVLEETGRATFDASGKMTRLVGVSTDITARRRAEEAAKEAENNLKHERDILRLVMNGATNCHLVFLDRDFNFVCVNEAYAKSCGYLPEEMVGKNHFALYPDAENEAIFMRVRDTGVPAHFHDKPFVFPEQPDRGITYWDWNLVPVTDDSGLVSGLVFSLIETTNRERAEIALRASGDRLRLVLEASAMGTFEIDIDTGATRWNAMLYQLLGLRPGDITPAPQNFFQFVHPDDFSFARQQFERALQQGRLDAEFRIIRADGEMRWLAARGQYIEESNEEPGAQGRSLRFMGVNFDITERKRVEEELRKLNARLESRVRARTAEVARQKEDLRRLAARIASAQDEEQRRIAEGLHDGVAQLLVTATFKLAQLTDSRLSRKLRPDLVELENLLAESLRSIRSMTFEFASATLAQLGLDKAMEELCQNMTARHGVHFSFVSRGKMRRLPRRTATILLKSTREMMFNVVKHAGAKEATITLSNDPRVFRITIADNGRGFKTRGDHHPTGVGILSVTERMRTIGGRVAIKSAPGNGTKVSLILPPHRTRPRRNGQAPRHSTTAS